jgi:hypothetical protein
MAKLVAILAWVARIHKEHGMHSPLACHSSANKVLEYAFLPIIFSIPELMP